MTAPGPAPAPAPSPAPPPRERLLVVDDDPVTCRLLEEVFAGEGYEVEKAHSAQGAVERHRAAPFDAVISDIRMGEGLATGLDALRTLKAESPDLVVVIITAFGSMDTAIEAMRGGAFDYVSKPFKIEEIKLAVRRGLEQRRRVAEARTQRTGGGEAAAAPDEAIVGRSRPMLEVYKLIAMVAPARTTVLIEGESGTGKELVARAIHRESPRASKPFLALNCAAIPEGLLESELFGHARGAFTSAVQEKRGLFEEASGGTLFLDEVGDTSLAVQSKVLRALQEQEVRRVGSMAPIRVDVRLVAATNRDLRTLVDAGRFREDLYYRLNVVTIKLPPLRERVEDVPLLAAHFLRRHAAARDGPAPAIAPEAMDALREYRWPGNVRELEHVIERAVTLASANRPVILFDDLPEAVRVPGSSESGRISLESLREDAEREHIMRVLKATGGNRTDAARLLGIDRKTLYRKAMRYGLRLEPGD